MIAILVCYLGILFLTNTKILSKENHEIILELKQILTFIKKNSLAIIAAIASCTFQAFNFIAGRRIGMQVHSSA